MGGVRHLRLSVGKHLLQRSRKPGALICELCTPVALLLALAAAWSLSPAAELPDGVYASSGNCSTIEPFGPWLSANAVGAGGGMIAVVPDNAATRAQVARWDGMHPALDSSKFLSAVLAKAQAAGDITPAEAAALQAPVAAMPAASRNLPNISASVVFFSDEAALTAYVTDHLYRKAADKPGLAAAVVYTSMGPKWAYSIRVNATAQPDPGRPVDILARQADLGPQRQLMAGGDIRTFDPQAGRPVVLPSPSFVAVQRLVDAAIINAQVAGGVAAVPVAAKAAYIQSSLPVLRSAAALPWWSKALTATLADPTLPADLAAFFGALAAAPQGMATCPFPTTALINDGFFSTAGDALPIFIVLAMLLPSSALIRAIVTEKETRQREGMLMMGQSYASYMASWYASYAIQYAVSAASLLLVTSWAMYKDSDQFILFIYFYVFLMSLAALCVLVSTLFSRAKTAAIMGPLAIFALFAIYFARSDDMSTGELSLMCLAGPACFGLGLDVLNAFGGQLQGVTFDTLGTNIDEFNMGLCIGMMLLDIGLYAVLAWYFDNVLPSEFGVPRPFWFPCTRHYWIGEGQGKRRRSVGGAVGSATPLGEAGASAVNPMDPRAAFFEPVGEALASLSAQGKSVSVTGITKIFSTPDGPFTAVKRLSLEMFEGQVTCLLGHNGAGKSTTISMLTGLLPPTEGDATVLGRSIVEDMDGIRNTLGVCPQHDVLFEDLTVRENLSYFAGIKGLEAAEVPAAVNKMIAEVGLTEKADVACGTLSGGQKRKVSVGIALIGGSKVVFLDEPTSGMDPWSRRSTWELIKNARKSRVIVLTTHFMDEADILGDRIAIMAAGEVQCCGSSMFLKGKYGVGYALTLVKQSRASPAAAAAAAAAGTTAESKADPAGPTTTLTPTQQAKAIFKLVHKHVPEAEPLSDVGMEVSFQLPLSASSSFKALFDELDGAKAALGLAQYGISATTLEEVFLRVASAGHNDHTTVRQLSQRALQRAASVGSISEAELAEAASAVDESEVKAGIDTVQAIKDRTRASAAARATQNLFWRHFVALIKKRFWLTTRDRKALIFQVLIPVVVMTAGFALLAGGSPTNVGPRVLGSGDYNKPLIDLGLTPDFLVPYSPAAATFGASYAASSAAADAVATALNANYTTVAVPARDYVPAAALANDGSTGFKVDLSQGAFVGAALNMSYYLLATKADTRASRYGAFAMLDASASQPAGSPAASGAADRLYDLLLMQNSTGTFTIPDFTNALHAALLRAVTGDATADITTTAQPMPFTNAELGARETGNAFVSSLLIAIAFSFIPASYAVAVVKEREVSSKHQQLISGVSIPAYWISSFAWDVSLYTITFGLSLMVMLLFDLSTFNGDAFGPATALLALYAPAAAPLTYLLSFAFKSHSSAQNAMLGLNLFGVLALLIFFIMGLIPDEDVCVAAQWGNGVFRVLPTYALANGFLNLAMRDFLPLGTCDRSQTQLFTGAAPDDFSITGVNIMYMAVTCVVCLLGVIAMDMALSMPKLARSCSRDPKLPEAPYEKEEDVEAEAERVRSGAADRAGDVVVINGLRKVYPGGKRAVRRLNFGIPAGECMGLLGINGAGKTSAFKMLSGDSLPTEGSATLGGFDILNQQIQVRRLLGYCPQFDALLELLSVREHLELFARIKGIPEADVPSIVDTKLNELDLVKYANKLAGRLSGGNKRKLSVAIAMIGDPPIVFLDEPSTGMDPMARRFMWRVIADLAKTSSIILTTHSMEECEALCSRVGIMVGGRLRCLGSIQHLKSRYGKGYQLDLKIATSTPARRAHVLREMAAACTGAKAGGAVDLRVSRALQEVAEAVPAAAVQVGRPAPASASATAGRTDGEPSPADVAVSKAGDHCMVPEAEVRTILGAMGHDAWVGNISPEGTGWAIYHACSQDGRVSAATLAEWVALERSSQAVAEFMAASFPGSRLLEMQDGLFRYKLPEAGKSLGTMFDAIEREQDRLWVIEYALSQTSLEMIFNSFAAQQDEEKGVARGLQASSPTRAASSNAGSGSARAANLSYAKSKAAGGGAGGPPGGAPAGRGGPVTIEMGSAK